MVAFCQLYIIKEIDDDDDDECWSRANPGLQALAGSQPAGNYSNPAVGLGCHYFPPGM